MSKGSSSGADQPEGAPDSQISRQQAMLNCQGLVRSLAWKIYQKLPANVDMEDLIAYGQLGLAEAAASFDAARGFAFTTFAYYRIRGAILDGLSQLSWFDPGDYHGSRYRQPHPSGDAAEDDDDLFEPPRETESRRRMVSLSGTNRDFEDRREVLPETALALQEMCQRLRTLVADMPGDEGKLLRAAYLDDIPLTVAADRLGISKSWASRLHERALKQLGRSLEKPA